MVSIMPIGAGSSADSARPILPTTLSTSGTLAMARSCVLLTSTACDSERRRHERRHVEERALVQRRHELAPDAGQDAAFLDDRQCRPAASASRSAGSWPPPQQAGALERRPLSRTRCQRSWSSSSSGRVTSASGGAYMRPLELRRSLRAGEQVHGPFQRVQRAMRCPARRVRPTKQDEQRGDHERLLVAQDPAQRRDVGPGDQARDTRFFSSGRNRSRVMRTTQRATPTPTAMEISQPWSCPRPQGPT